MILHLLQIFLTDALTFTTTTPFLALPKDNPSQSQIVGRQVDLDFIPRQDLYVVHPHLARYVSESLMSVVQLHSEHRVGQGLQHLPGHFDGIFFRHIKILGYLIKSIASYNLLKINGPFLVTATECSK